MSDSNATPFIGAFIFNRSIGAMLSLFVLSGCSALIYEIVWFQMLGLVIGSSAISLGILLGMFMGGMCLGSIAVPRLVSPRHHPLRVYALMELGISVAGLSLLFGMPLASGLYTASASADGSGLVMRGLIAGLCLVPPACLMGATLPAISRWTTATPEGVAWLGYFYGGNIAGAVIGSLLAGFYLLRLYDVSIATYVAVALNLAAAVGGLGIARKLPYELLNEEDFHSDESRAPGSWPVYVVIAVSGMTALAAEVVWTRYLSLIFGATVYAFSLILAVFLIGLGIGASTGAAIAGKVRQPRAALGWCQLLLCVAIAWTAYQLAMTLPYWRIDPSRAADAWYRFRFDFLRSMWAMLPPAILWGASFPLALASVATKREDSGRWVGRVYGANTAGTILGALAASLFLIPSVGSRRVQQGLIYACAISGVLILSLLLGRNNRKGGISIFVLWCAVMLGAEALSKVLPNTPSDLIAYGRRVADPSHAKVIYAGEGLTASIAVSQSDNGVLNYHSAGKIQASSEYPDMRLQRMLGHLTTLLPDNPRSFLVIGLGAGVTAGAVSVEPRIKRETVVEIEPLVPKVVSRYFREYNFDVASQPKVRVRVDDGRHYLLTTKATFDGITSDPFDPWVKGTAALYTKEFFELARRHLNPGGVVTQFVQLYESNEEAVKSQIATFFEVFPNGLLFANTNGGQGYDVVLVGRADDGVIDVDGIDDRLGAPEYARMAQSLREIGIYSAADLFSAFVGRASDLRPWLKDAVINRDRNLRLQYLAGMGLNLQNEGEIFRHMIAFGPKFPSDIFKGSSQTKDYIKRAIESGTFR